MRKAVDAVLYHCSEAATPEARHMAENKGELYVDKPGLPITVRNAIFPIFQDLSPEELLKKCLHGKTQNNEALNNIIWTRLPKNVFVGWYTFQIGVSSAVISFNFGSHGLLGVFRKLNIVVISQKMFCVKSDMTRIRKMKGKRIRKRRRAQKKGFAVKSDMTRIRKMKGKRIRKRRRAQKKGFAVKSDMTRIRKMKGKRIRKRRRAQKKGFAVRDVEKEGELYASGLF